MSVSPNSANKNSNLLYDLISNWENETIEFKEASKDYDTDKIGRYVSALSNEANLSECGSAWLVFGVRNKTREVVGSDYRTDPERLNGLKFQIGSGTEPSMTFRSVKVLDEPAGRVIMFEIPAAPQGMPIAWKGQCFARAGESLIPLSFDKQDAIRRQDHLLDWTAQVVNDATVSDLSSEALKVARRAFTDRNASRIAPETIDNWSDEQFLMHVGLMTKRGIVRAAFLLNPLMAELTWKLVGQEAAYEHFTIPFILATTELYGRIRNIKMRLLPQASSYSVK